MNPPNRVANHYSEHIYQIGADYIDRNPEGYLTEFLQDTSAIALSNPGSITLFDYSAAGLVFIYPDVLLDVIVAGIPLESVEITDARWHRIYQLWIPKVGYDLETISIVAFNNIINQLPNLYITRIYRNDKPVYAIITPADRCLHVTFIDGKILIFATYLSNFMVESLKNFAVKMLPSERQR